MESAAYNECLQNLSRNPNISSAQRQKICQIINGMSVDEDKSKKDLMHLWFNDPRLITAIYQQSGLRVTPEITCSAHIVDPMEHEANSRRNGWATTRDKTIQYKYFSGVSPTNDPSSGSPVRKTLDIQQFFKIANLEKNASSGELFAIPFKLTGSYITGSHENTLICQVRNPTTEDSSAKKVMVVEMFEPHGKFFLGKEAKYRELNEFIHIRAEDLIHMLFDEIYEITIIYPNDLCPLTEKRVLQGLTSEEWSGSCTFFPMWYTFLRLTTPSRSPQDTFNLMNNLLKTYGANEVVRMIFSTFTDLIQFNIANFSINGKPSFLRATRDSVLANTVPRKWADVKQNKQNKKNKKPNEPVNIENEDEDEDGRPLKKNKQIIPPDTFELSNTTKPQDFPASPQPSSLASPPAGSLASRLFGRIQPWWKGGQTPVLRKRCFYKQKNTTPNNTGTRKKTRRHKTIIKNKRKNTIKRFNTR